MPIKPIKLVGDILRLSLDAVKHIYRYILKFKKND